MATQSKPKVLVLDQEKVVGLMRVTAYLAATDAYTTVKKKETEGVIEWGMSAVTRRDILEIVTDDAGIERFRKKILTSYLDQWEKKVETGPQAALAFLEELEKKKIQCQDMLNRKYSMVIKNNQEVADSASTAVKIAAGVKFGSTVTNTILGNFTPAGFIVSFLQEVSMDFCSTLSEAQEADSIAISNAAAGTVNTAVGSGINHALEDGTVWVVDKIGKWAENRHYEIYKQLRGANYSMAAKDAAPLSSALVSDTVKSTKKAAHMMGSSKGVKVLGTRIPGLNIVFTAKSIMDAWSQFQEEIK